MSDDSKKFLAGAWLVGLSVTLISVLAWGQDNTWHFSPFSAYQVFPVLGLTAFGLMWSHYVVGTLRDLLGIKKESIKNYFAYTGWAVLALICLHPSLLIYQRFRDGFGIPPKSYETYVGDGLGWVTLLGTASLLVFLAFEFHRKFGKKPWWHYVTDASDLAMLAILYHGFRLGTDLQHGWFRWVWLFYAVTFVAAIARKYYLRLKKT